ncbi:Pumilio homolog 1 (APUM-1) (AtPUM1) [Durusdinium trenchii]
MLSMPAVPQQNQSNMHVRQQEAWNVQVMQLQCMLGFWNKQQANFPNQMMNQMNQMNPMNQVGMGLAPWACGAMPMAFAPQGMGMQGMIGMQGAFPQTMPFCGPPNFEGPRFFAFPMAPVQQQDPNMAQMGQSSSADWGQFQGYEQPKVWRWAPPAPPAPAAAPPAPEADMPDDVKDFVAKALDAHACWDLQDFIPDASNAELKFMATQLRGHVREVVESPHGNHVLQRMLEFMPAKSLHFVLEEMLAWAPAPVLARHRYGCRVLERILEHFAEPAIKGLLEDLLYYAKELCLHPFGNFVMQIFMEHSPTSYRKALIEIIAQNIVPIAGDHNGCAVLEKGLSWGKDNERKTLVKAILKVEGLLPAMKTLRGGAMAIEGVLGIATGWALSEAQRQLSGGSAKMIKSRGRWRAQDQQRRGRRS